MKRARSVSKNDKNGLFAAGTSTPAKGLIPVDTGDRLLLGLHKELRLHHLYPRCDPVALVRLARTCRALYHEIAPSIWLPFHWRETLALVPRRDFRRVVEFVLRNLVPSPLFDLIRARSVPPKLGLWVDSKERKLTVKLGFPSKEQGNSMTWDWTFLCRSGARNLGCPFLERVKEAPVAQPLFDRGSFLTFLADAQLTRLLDSSPALRAFAIKHAIPLPLVMEHLYLSERRRSLRLEIGALSALQNNVMNKAAHRPYLERFLLPEIASGEHYTLLTNQDNEVDAQWKEKTQELTVLIKAAQVKEKLRTAPILIDMTD